MREMWRVLELPRAQPRLDGMSNVVVCGARTAAAAAAVARIGARELFGPRRARERDEALPQRLTLRGVAHLHLGTAVARSGELSPRLRGIRARVVCAVRVWVGVC